MLQSYDIFYIYCQVLFLYKMLVFYKSFVIMNVGDFMSIKRYQFKNKKQLEKMNFHLLYISTSLYEGDWHSTLHTHHCTELFYVLRGKGSFLADEEHFDIKEDDLIIVNPNVMHTEMSKNDEPLEYIVLGIEGLQFTTMSKGDLMENYSIHNYYDYKHEILFYMKTLLQEMEQEDVDYEIICQDLLEVLIINMVRRTKANMIVAPSQKITKECRFIEQYINNHFTEDITLELLSEKSYMNKYYLVHAFKQYKGVSPINYLISKRVESAKELLATTNYTIAQISDLSGFSSQSYFSQVFKKATMMSPNEYRKANDQSEVG